MDGGEEALERTKTLERLSEGVVSLDTDLVFTDANGAALDMLDGGDDDIIGEFIWDVFPGPDDEGAVQRIESAVETGEEVTEEQYVEECDQWFEVRVYPDDEGLTLVFSDVTERKSRERQFRQLHEATRRLVTAESQDAVAEMVCTAADEILDRQTNGVHRYDESEDGLVPVAVSERIRELLDDVPVLTEGIAWTAYETGEPRVYEDVREADNVFDSESVMRSEIALPLGEYGVLILSSTEPNAFDDDDVRMAKLLASNAETVLSERAKERKLEEREKELERAETLFTNAQDAFFLIDVDRESGEYRIERVNPAYESVSGFSNEEIRGQSIADVFGAGDASEIRAHYDACVERKEPVSYVERLSVPEPGTYWDTRIAPVVVDGEVIQIVGATRNVTEQKAYERQLKEQRDDLELLNQMVRHDIRNDLQVISSYAELLASRVGQENHEFVERILENARNAVELTRTARDLSGTMLQSDEETEAVPLRSVLNSQVDEIRTAYPDTILTVDGQVPSVAVQADDLLSSVFRNILKNAIQHNDADVSEVTVAVDARDDHVRVTIADNGPGIPDDQKETVFGKGEKGLESEGTGIGLYLVNTLMARYGGDIQVHDNEPRGTIVSLLFDRV